MKELQCNMLAALDRVRGIAPGTWRDVSVQKLRALLEDHPDAGPHELKAILRRKYPYQLKRGKAYKAWCWVKRYALEEATGLARMRRQKQQDADARLFTEAL